jgi:hypothetical protein
MSETNAEKIIKAREMKMYSSWAFKEDEAGKLEANAKMYDVIKDLAEVSFIGYGHNHEKYKVVSNPYELPTNWLALIADKGNLCFGYRMEGPTIVIHTD